MGTAYIINNGGDNVPLDFTLSGTAWKKKDQSLTYNKPKYVIIYLLVHHAYN